MTIFTSKYLGVTLYWGAKNLVQLIVFQTPTIDRIPDVTFRNHIVQTLTNDFFANVAQKINLGRALNSDHSGYFFSVLSLSILYFFSH